jgi:diguanylate cyclase (GGDEF)-like protein
LTYLQNFAKHLLPSLLLFMLALLIIEFQGTLLEHWFAPLDWLAFASLGIAAVICVQFGRSRLFFCCLLLLILRLSLDGWLSLTPGFQAHLGAIIMLQVSWLMWSKDKGFAPLNLLVTAGQLALVGLISWFALPYLIAISKPQLTDLYSFFYQINPKLNALFTPFEWLYIAVLILAALLKFIYISDNNHSALLLTMVVLVTIQAYADNLLTRVFICILGFSYIYAVLKDSFNMAFRDELTAIPSRRALMQYVNTLGRKYTVAMADIDHFKKFNDTYGHDVGDDVLRLVASRLNKVKGGGRAFRYGGEEFIIIFPRTDVHQARPYIEHIRQAIADYPITLRDKSRPKKPPKKISGKTTGSKTVKITASFGIAQTSSQHNQFADIMKQADVALYAAKKAGRNCIHLAKI